MFILRLLFPLHPIHPPTPSTWDISPFGHPSYTLSVSILLTSAIIILFFPLLHLIYSSIPRFSSYGCIQSEVLSKIPVNVFCTSLLLHHNGLQHCPFAAETQFGLLRATLIDIHINIIKIMCM